VAIAQTIHALRVEALKPFGNVFGVVLNRRAVAVLSARHAALLSCQAGILVAVHSALRESLGFDNISVPGQERMGNLLKV
jgi:hypothetical protein